MIKRFLTIITLLITMGLTSAIKEDSNKPKRIISLGPYITEDIFLLQGEKNLVGCTTYCQRPQAAKKILRVADAMKVNIEKVLSLKPDLILAADLVNRREIQKLRKLGLKVNQFPIAKNFKDICSIFKKTGQLIGKSKRAEEIVLRENRRLQTLQAEIKPVKKTSCFIQIGANPLFTINKTSFINDLIEKGGGYNIAKQAAGGIFSREAVLRENPEVIILVTMGMTAKREMREWQKFSSLSAVQNKRIFLVDANQFCSPTPVSFVDSVEYIIKLLHPTRADNALK